MRKFATAAIVAALASTGCYHATIDTGRSPSGQTIERPWAHSFIGGLVPPSVTETASRCPNGVARVETKLSFLNMVANAVTFGIYSPMTIEVQCAGGAPENDAELLRSEPGAEQDAMDLAVRRSLDTGAAVFVDLN